LSDELAE
ncbi:hypothetical protein D047_1499B, partial [Vibrio parahaemolyticus VPTS-2010_2]